MNLQKKVTSHLKKDPTLGVLVDRYDFPVFRHNVNLFTGLIDSIISQQLSIKAGNTIFNRFKSMFDSDLFPNPYEIVNTPDEKIRTAGISFPKIKYLKGLSEAIIKKELDLAVLERLSDEEVIQNLTKVKGVGRWTAEMFLISSLKRSDVFSVGDLGLRTAVSKLYKVERDNIKRIEKIAEVWKPYRTFASKYLWKSLENT